MNSASRKFLREALAAYVPWRVRSCFCARETKAEATGLRGMAVRNQMLQPQRFFSPERGKISTSG